MNFFARIGARGGVEVPWVRDDCACAVSWLLCQVLNVLLAERDQ